jgi:hypothetical protein
MGLALCLMVKVAKDPAASDLQSAGSAQAPEGFGADKGDHESGGHYQRDCRKGSSIVSCFCESELPSWCVRTRQLM